MKQKYVNNIKWVTVERSKHCYLYAPLGTCNAYYGLVRTKVHEFCSKLVKMLSECQTAWFWLRRRVTRLLIQIQAVCIWNYSCDGGLRVNMSQWAKGFRNMYKHLTGYILINILWCFNEEILFVLAGLIAIPTFPTLCVTCVVCPSVHPSVRLSVHTNRTLCGYEIIRFRRKLAPMWLKRTKE